MSLRIYYGSDLVAQGFSSTSTIMDSGTAYYEIMPVNLEGIHNNGLLTMLLILRGPLQVPFPASSSTTYSSEADMLSQFNTAGITPIYSQTHLIIGTYDLIVPN